MLHTSGWVSLTVMVINKKGNCLSNINVGVAIEQIYTFFIVIIILDEVVINELRNSKNID